LFYPDDFSSDGKVEAMSTEEVGAYMLLLCKSWREDPPGSIPTDDAVLARWARLTPDRWAECRTGVLAAFSLGTDSRWHQPRLRSEYNKLLEAQRKKQEAGLAGARGRWQPHADANAVALAKDAISSSSSTTNHKVKTRAESARGDPNLFEQKRRIEARDLRLQKEAETLSEARVGSRPEGGNMPPRTEYVDFIKLRDDGRIARHVTWATWRTLTDPQRIDLIDKPGPQAVRPDVDLKKVGST
jgi:uncharacterized protein YdaU (DUF1376 family)